MKHFKSILCVVPLLAIAIQNTGAQSGTVQLQSQEAGRIRGVVFDSLRMKPVAGATVMLMDGTATVLSDGKGRFELAGIAPGKHFVAFNTPTIDSLGLGTLGAEVSVLAGVIVNLNLATPSIHTLFTYRCPKGNAATASRDSGIVWGTIRDAETNSEIEGAKTDLAWYSLRSSPIPGLKLDQIRREVGTDQSGLYFACGVPDDILISSIAIAPYAASGSVQYVIGEQRFKRLDLLVSTDMVIPDSVRLLTHEDSVAADHPHGQSILHGTVTDEKKRPLENAIVAIATSDTSVRTRKDGSFTLGRLPGGTQIIEVRRVGFAPFLKVVELRPKQQLDVVIEMPAAYTLAAVTVRANLVKGADRVEYEGRKKLGFGTFIETKDLAGRPDVATPLSRVPGVQVDYTEAGFDVSMRSPFMRGRCSPSIFLDGFPSTLDVVNMRSGDSFRAIEVYPHGGLVPPEYARLNGCGAILFWSANARW